MSNFQRIGYVRVSTEAQRTERQLDGVPLDRTFEDKVSGKSTERPQLAAMMAYARQGDMVIVHSMDRLARNLRDLLALVRQLTEKGVKVEFRKENLVFSGEDSPMATLTLQMMGAFAEFERSLILERQREGIALAKARKAFKGRKESLTLEQKKEVRRKAGEGVSKAKLAKDYSVSRTTIYEALKGTA